jgi:hypothetical protein
MCSIGAFLRKEKFIVSMSGIRIYDEVHSIQHSAVSTQRAYTALGRKRTAPDDYRLNALLNPTECFLTNE